MIGPARGDDRRLLFIADGGDDACAAGLGALAFAKGNGINTLDVNGLLSLIATRTEAQRQDLLRIALEGDYWRPTCASCGIKLVERRPKSGGNSFWGCANFPRCKTKMSMKLAQAN